MVGRIWQKNGTHPKRSVSFTHRGVGRDLLQQPEGVLWNSIRLAQRRGRCLDRAGSGKSPDRPDSGLTSVNIRRISPSDYPAVGTRSAIQVFSKSNHQWAAKEIADEDVDALLNAIKDTEIPIVCAHASYLINLASPDPELSDR